jgi:hypothetical protein
MSWVRDPRGEWFFFNLPNPSGRTKPWGLVSIYQKQKSKVFEEQSAAGT